MSQPELHMSSLALFEQLSSGPKPIFDIAPPRTHSDLTRPLYTGLEELVTGGLLREAGRVWWCGDKVVARELAEPDGQGRYRKYVAFGSWLCLAMALKVSREDTRQALMDAVKKHPEI